MQPLVLTLTLTLPRQASGSATTGPDPDPDPTTSGFRQCNHWSSGVSSISVVIFSSRWHRSIRKGPYALRPVSHQSPHGCPRNNICLVEHRSFPTLEGGMSTSSFLHSSFLQAINAVMLWPVHVQKDPQASCCQVPGMSRPGMTGSKPRSPALDPSHLSIDGAQLLVGWWVACKSLSNMLVYLTDGSALTILSAATLR